MAYDTVFRSDPVRSTRDIYGDPTWGDYGSLFANVGGAELAVAPFSLARWLAEAGLGEDSEFGKSVAENAGYFEKKIRDYGAASFEDLSPAAKEAVTAEIFSDEFMANPASSTFLKLTRIAPSTIASIGATIGTGGLASAAIIGATGGAISAGQYLNDVHAGFDDKSDAELQETSPLYKQLRSEGANENVARVELDNATIGAKPFLLMGIGALTSNLGPAGQVSRNVLGKGVQRAVAETGEDVAQRGIIKRVGKEFAQGAGAEAGQTFAEAVSTEQTFAEAGMKPIDWRSVGMQTAEGSFLGGIMGGVAGIPSGRRAQARTPPSADTTTADPRAHPDNPSGASIEGFRRPDATNFPLPSDVAGIDPFTGGPSSMPPRGGDTQNTPPIVPSGTPTRPAGAVPGAEAVSTQPTLPGVSMGLPGASTPAINDNARIVMDDTQAAALGAMNTQPLPETVTPGAMPAPSPTTPRGSTAPPAEGSGAGTPTPGAVPTGPITWGGGAVEAGEPVLDSGTAVFPREPRTIDERRALDTVPDQAMLDLVAIRQQQEQARTIPAKAEVAPGTLRGKDAERNQKLLDDGVKAQALLGERPGEPDFPTDAKGFIKLRAALQRIVKRAQKQGVELREKVGYDTTPDSLVWLSEAQALVKKLSNKKLSAADKLDAATGFLVAEQQLLSKGDASLFRGKRAAEGEEVGRGILTADETIADTGEAAVSEEQAAAREAGEAEPEVQTVTPRTKVTRPKLGIEDYAGTHKNKATGQTGPRQKATTPGKSTLTSAERAELIAEETEKRKPLTAKAAAAVEKGRKRAEAKEKKAAVKLAQERVEAEAKLKQAKKEGVALNLAQAEADLAAIIKAEKQQKKKRPTKLEKAMAVAAAKKEAAAREQAEAEEKAEVEARAKKQMTPKTKKAMAALETAKRIAAKKKAAKEAKSKAAAETRKPLRGEPLPRKAKPLPEKVTAVKDRVEARRIMRLKEGKVKLDEEIAKVEEDPSPAKQEADNFTKGHVSIEGVPISLETKDGFGQIPGTKGASGGPVKVLLGEEAIPGNANIRTLPVVVIDQVNPDTGAQEDHVVLYGFEDPQAAVNEYEGNFPDQMGDFAIMSFDEFRTWLASKSSEPVGVPLGPSESTLEELKAAIAEIDAEDASVIPENYRDAVVAARAESARLENLARGHAYASGPLDRFLTQGQADIALHDITGPGKALFPEFASRVRRMAGDIIIYFVPDEIYAQMGRPPRSAGFYDSLSDIIVIPRKSTSNRIELARLLLHEGAHAAVQKATYENPKLVRDLFRIFDEAKKTWASIDPILSPYGLTSVNEMLAEAFSSPRFQEFLLKTKASEKLKADLGLSEKVKSMWDALVQIVADAFGYSRAAYGHQAHESLMSAIMKVSEQLEPIAEDIGRGPMTDQQMATLLVNWEQRRADTARDITPISSSERLLPESVTSRFPEKFRPAPHQKQVATIKLLFLRTLNDLAHAAEFYGVDFSKPVRAVADALLRIHTSAKAYLQKWLPLMLKMHDMQHKYKGTEWWEKFMQLMHDETSAGVFAHLPLSAQKFLGGADSLRGAYPKGRHADLSKRWAALPDDMKALRIEILDFYQQRQNEVHFKRLKNILRVAGHRDEALAHRIFNDTETEADKKLLGAVYEHIKDVEEASRIEGPYYPQMRRGNWVVQARYKIKPPRDAQRAIPDEDGKIRTWEFGGAGMSVAEAERRAMAYAAAQDAMHPTVSSVWVNATGERFFTNEDGNEQRVAPTDIDSENRFRVSIQNEYVGFFDKQRTAEEVAEELKTHADVEPDSVRGVEERRFQLDSRTADVASSQMKALISSLKRQRHFKDLSPGEQNTVEQTLLEASLRILSHTRIQTKNLPRRHVLGASTDATTNMGEYSQSVSGYMARLDHQQDLNEAMQAARAQVGTDAHKSAGRSVLMNELEKRVTTASAFPDSKGGWDGAVKRWLIASYLARLVSPATITLNMLQPTTTSLPLFAARFGPGRAAKMMLKVYKDVGAGKILKSGLVATGRAIAKGARAEPTTMIEDILANLSTGEQALINELIALGSIDPDAGIEMDTLLNMGDTLGARADRVLDFGQRFGRQMPRAVEVVNRVVTAVAAYRLEMQKNGGNHEAAVKYAQKTTNITQGIYSHTNAAPVFKHPLARISLQFKQYAQLIYSLMAHQFEKAYHNAEPGDRAEAIKSFAYMMATYGVVAGTLGLPTEPLKLVFMLAGGSIGGVAWSDIEHYERQLAADLFGKNMGEIVTHGISRALPEGLSFDLSSRVGLQDLLLFGEPRAQNEQAVQAYLWELVGGAPVALFKDWAKGVQALRDGDILESMQKFSPLKVTADLVKAYRTSTEGKKSGAGYTSLTPYSATEAAVRAFGFTPAREAEAGEASRYFYSREERGSAERRSYMHQWAAASGSERARLWGQVEKFNSRKPEDEKLTRADLDRYTKSRKTMEKSRRSGLRVTRREQSLYEDIGNVYNISP